MSHAMPAPVRAWRAPRGGTVAAGAALAVPPPPGHGSTLEPASAAGVRIGAQPPEPASSGLLVAGTIALVGALRARRRRGA